MDLETLLETLNKCDRKKKSYVFYLNKDTDEVESIVFQNGVFFRLEMDGLAFLNPIRASQIIKKIIRKEIKLLGSGCYGKELKLSKKYKGSVAI